MKVKCYIVKIGKGINGQGRVTDIQSIDVFTGIHCEPGKQDDKDFGLQEAIQHMKFKKIATPKPYAMTLEEVEIDIATGSLTTLSIEINMLPDIK